MTATEHAVYRTCPVCQVCQRIPVPVRYEPDPSGGVVVVYDGQHVRVHARSHP